MGLTYKLAMAAACLLAGSPGMAADDIRDAGNPVFRSGMFAGAGIRLPLDNRAATAGVRFSIGMTGLVGDPGTGMVVRTHRTPGLELGFAATGRPELFVAGARAREIRERLGLEGSRGTVLLAAGGVALAVAALLVLTDNGDDDSCLDPNLCD